MKKIKWMPLILLLMVGVSCKTEKKDSEAGTQASETKELTKPTFPVTENLLSNPALVNLTQERHAFEEDIVFEEINVLKTAENTYSFILVVDKAATNFDKLKSWKIAIMFFAKDPTQFSDDVLKKKGFKTTGFYADPKLMGNEVVILHENCMIELKELFLMRLYLYNNNNEMNTNYYNVKDIVLP